MDLTPAIEIKEDNFNGLVTEHIFLLKTLCKNEEFLNLKFLRDQIGLLHRLLIENKIKKPKSLLQKFFRKNPGSISRYIGNYEKEREGYSFIHGRKSLLSNEQMDILIKEIHERVKFYDNTSLNSLRDFIRNNFNLEIDKYVLRSIIERNKKLKIMRGIPMEKSRLSIGKDIIEKYFSEAEKLINDTPDSLIFNIDEVGYQEWADRKNMKMVVPENFEGKEYYFKINRNQKRSSMISCISLDGSFIKPVLVVQRKKIENELMLMGIKDSNCLIVYQECGFINDSIFYHWAEKILFPEIKKRKSEIKSEKNAVIILDNFLSHCSPEFHEKCEKEEIKFLYIPPHSSHLLQPLDLVTFSILKKKTSYQFSKIF